MVGTGDTANGNEGCSINSCLLFPPSSQRGSEPHGLKKRANSSRHLPLGLEYRIRKQHNLEMLCRKVGHESWKGPKIDSQETWRLGWPLPHTSDMSLNKSRTNLWACFLYVMGRALTTAPKQLWHSASPQMKRYEFIQGTAGSVHTAREAHGGHPGSE